MTGEESSRRVSRDLSSSIQPFPFLGNLKRRSEFDGEKTKDGGGGTRREQRRIAAIVSRAVFPKERVKGDRREAVDAVKRIA